MTPEMIAEILETVMILAFGLSWPLSIYKSVKSRTAKGKSLQFEIFIWLGYIAGIVMKCIQFFVIFYFIYNHIEGVNYCISSNCNSLFFYVFCQKILFT